MAMTKQPKKPAPELPKTETGINGFDEITEGGVPTGRTALICGGAGSGKTLFATEFLVKGATVYNEPGVFIAFEETPDELTQNVASLGFGLNDLVKQKKIVLDHVHIDRSEIEVTGEYDLEGLFVRIGYLLDSIKAKRIVIDTLEALFSNLDEGILRAELRRLFRWLKDRGVTAVITAEKGEDNKMTRHGLEEYVSDCVISLDHRVTEQISTRRLRVVKYRGSYHGTNEYPFLIEKEGISILPITAIEMNQRVSTTMISSGIERLDTLLGGGFYAGSTIMISGTAGTGKSSLAAYFANAVCKRGEKCIYLAFEEPESQILRNMRSIGLDLEPWIKQGLLKIHASRPMTFGIEMHLVKISKMINDFAPSAVIMDPLSNMVSIGSEKEVNSMLNRLIDHLKGRGITSFFTNLAHMGATEQTDIAISSIIDTWLLVQSIESCGERNRTLHILKSRGAAHSNQVREFHITEHGVELTNVYIGEGQVYTGSAREAQEAKDKAEALARKQEIAKMERELMRKRQTVESRMESLRLRLQQDEDDLKMALDQERLKEESLALTRQRQSETRKADITAEKKQKSTRRS